MSCSHFRALLFAALISLSVPCLSSPHGGLEIQAADKGVPNIPPSNWAGQPVPCLPAGIKVTRSFLIGNKDAKPAVIQLTLKTLWFLNPNKSNALPLQNSGFTIAGNSSLTIPFQITTPPVPFNGLMEILLDARVNGHPLPGMSWNYILVPQGLKGTQALFEGADSNTEGDWRGIYGEEGFFLPVHQGTAAFLPPNLHVTRGTGMEQSEDTPLENPQEKQMGFAWLDTRFSVQDKRVPLGGNGLTERNPIAFTAEPASELDEKTGIHHIIMIPLFMRIDALDGDPHRLSLYFLDYLRRGLRCQVDVYDVQGHLLDSRRLANYQEGIYLKYKFTGSIIVQIQSLNPTHRPLLSALFLDKASGKGLLWHSKRLNQRKRSISNGRHGAE